MNLYILPVQRVLLEYVLKLGDMIFFPGDVSNEAIEYSNLLDDEKEKLRLNCRTQSKFLYRTTNRFTFSFIII